MGCVATILLNIGKLISLNFIYILTINLLEIGTSSLNLTDFPSIIRLKMDKAVKFGEKKKPLRSSNSLVKFGRILEYSKNQLATGNLGKN